MTLPEENLKKTRRFADAADSWERDLRFWSDHDSGSSWPNFRCRAARSLCRLGPGHRNGEGGTADLSGNVV